MSLLQDQQAFSLDVSRLITHIYAHDYAMTFSEAWRTPEQAEIYFKEGKGIRNSLHIQRLAVDINLYSPHGEFLVNSKDYEEFGKYWESLNPHNRWGGYFVSKYGGKITDGCHFERKQS